MRVELTGSVAFKLALIAAGRGDGTFSLTPKHEWDVCAGAALIEEGGGRITDCYGQPLRFNREKPLLPGIIATNAPLFDPIRALIARSVGADGSAGARLSRAARATARRRPGRAGRT